MESCDGDKVLWSCNPNSQSAVQKAVSRAHFWFYNGTKCVVIERSRFKSQWLVAQLQILCQLYKSQVLLTYGKA